YTTDLLSSARSIARQSPVRFGDSVGHAIAPVSGHPALPRRWRVQSPSLSPRSDPTPPDAPAHSSGPGSSASVAPNPRIPLPDSLYRVPASAACRLVPAAETTHSAARNCAVVESTHSRSDRSSCSVPAHALVAACLPAAPRSLSPIPHAARSSRRRCFTSPAILTLAC